MIFSIIKNFIKYKILGKTSKVKTETLTITFVKQKEKWYADLPDWYGAWAQLEMVCGADLLLEELADEKDKVTLKVSTIPFMGAVELERTYHDHNGANYSVVNADYIAKDIWLCNVTHFALGEHPEKIYFKVIG